MGGHKFRYRQDGDPEFPGALCSRPDADPDMWHNDATEQQAKAICRVCPVLGPCAEWGTSRNAPQYGVLGGMNADRRSKIRRKRIEGGW